MKKFQKATTILSSLSASVLITTTNVFAKSQTAADKYLNFNQGQYDTPDEIWNKVFDIVQNLVTGATGVMTIILVGIFIYRCFNLAKSSNNPKERQEAIEGLLQTLIGIALFGGTSLFTGLAFRLLA